MNDCTLEQLLRMKVKGRNLVNNKDVFYSPDFRIAVQEVDDNFGVRIIVHANGHNSDTVDFWVKNDTLTEID